METILPSLTWVIIDVLTTILFFLIYVYKSVLPACIYMCNMHMSGASRARKRTLDPLEVELMNSC